MTDKEPLLDIERELFSLSYDVPQELKTLANAFATTGNLEMMKTLHSLAMVVERDAGLINQAIGADICRRVAENNKAWEQFTGNVANVLKNVVDSNSL